MSRAMIGEYVLTGVLVADSALAIGSGEEGTHTDIACIRDGKGRWIIPGSALAGTFRADFEDDLKAWGSKDFASQLFFEDAVWLPPNEAVHDEVRDGVGIDRRTGTAAPTALYTREVVPPGTRFNWELRLEVVQDNESLDRAAAEDWIRAAVARLSAGVPLGAATSAGLGMVRLEGAELEWIGIGDRDSLLAYLSGATAKEKVQYRPALSPNRLRITCPWRANSPLLVSVPVNGLVDRMPQTTRKGGGGTVHLVIPGTSIKGALRSRAEWILRTVSRAPAPEGFLDQMNDPGVIGQLFGRPPMGRGSNRQRGARGALRVHEVLSKQNVRSWTDIRQKLMTARPGGSGDPGLTARAEARRRAADALAARGGLLRINDHVAISRWTGGADEGKLFATVAPLPVDGYWEDMVFDVDLSRLASREDIERVMLLFALLLRDLGEGWIGIGHGTTRGYGEVAAQTKDIRWEFSEVLPHGLSLPEQVFSLSELLTGARFEALRKRLTEVGLTDSVTKNVEEAGA